MGERALTIKHSSCAPLTARDESCLHAQAFIGRPRTVSATSTDDVHSSEYQERSSAAIASFLRNRGFEPVTEATTATEAAEGANPGGATDVVGGELWTTGATGTTTSGWRGRSPIARSTSQMKTSPTSTRAVYSPILYEVDTAIARPIAPAIGRRGQELSQSPPSKHLDSLPMAVRPVGWSTPFSCSG